MTHQQITLAAQPEPLLDGGYGVCIQVGQDRAWMLDREQTVAYAMTCFERATEAEHDAAIYTLLQCCGVPAEEAARTVNADIRSHRVPDDSATAPLMFATGVQPDGRPYIQMGLDGIAVGALSPDVLRHHGAVVISVLTAADLNTRFREALIGPIGVEENRARTLVGAIQKHWPGRVHQ